MAPPVAVKPWLYDVNNRVTGGVLLTASRTTMFEIVNTFLIGTVGLTIVGSSDSVTAALDATNRWLAIANLVRGANTTTPASWIILQDANGMRFLIDFVGTTDDVWRISCSPTGFTLAGTPTHTPTATDECTMNVALSTSVVGSTAAGDRLWHGWYTADKKNFRIAIGRNGNVVSAWGVEEVNATGMAGTGNAFTPPAWGFFYTRTNLSIGSVTAAYTASRGGTAVVSIGGIPTVVSIGGGVEYGAGAVAYGSSNVCEFNGPGNQAMPLSSWMSTVTAKGKLGNRFDWYCGKGGGSEVDYVGNYDWIQMNETLWPWPGGGLAPVWT